jgi:hypothetical protein
MEGGGTSRTSSEITRELAVSSGDKMSNTFDIDKELNKDDSLDYEEKRVLLKLGTFKSAVLLFQGTVGLVLFTLQKPLEMVGLAWGLVVTIISGYITCYGLLQMASLATEVETDFNFKRKIKNFDELARQIQGRYVPHVKWLMMISGICMMYASTVSNLLLVATNMQSSFGVSDVYIKGVIFLIISFIFILIVEPEKIQYINTYMTSILILLAYMLFGRNLYLYGTSSTRPSLSNIKMVDFKYTGMFAGNVAYAFEVASNYLSLRLTSSAEVNYSKLTLYMMVFVGLNYYLCAAGHVIAFESHEMTDNSFEMHGKKSGQFWRSLVYVFMVNTLYTFTFNTIFTCEIIESIPAIHSKIADHKGTFNRVKLVGLRIFLWGIAVVISLYAKNIIYILNFSGSVFTPVVSYFGPLFLTYSYAAQKSKQVSIGKKIHDTIYVLLALVISAWGIMNTF